MRPVRMPLFLILLLLAAPEFAACVELTPTYSIKDSGMPALSYGGVIWLDNQRVLFTGPKVAARKEGTSTTNIPIEYETFVWDTAQGGVTPYQALQGAAKVCVRGDFISYIRRKPETEKEWLRVYGKVHDGQIVEEQVMPLPSQQWFNPFSCRYYDGRPYWAIEGRETHPLLEEHSYLDWGVALSPATQGEYYKNTPITFFPGGGKEGIPLPIGRREVWWNLISYAPFSNAYLFWPIVYMDKKIGREGAVGTWPKGEPFPVWWLTPEGKVAEIKIPYQPWISGATIFYPMRKGIFISSRRAKNLGEPGDAGGYLLQGGELKKLITGFLEKVAVSTDGCKAAVVHDPYDNRPVIHRVTLKMLDVCNGGSHAN